MSEIDPCTISTYKIPNLRTV